VKHFQELQAMMKAGMMEAADAVKSAPAAAAASASTAAATAAAESPAAAHAIERTPTLPLANGQDNDEPMPSAEDAGECSRKRSVTGIAERSCAAVR
jgi:hypothetical protein